MTDSTQRFSNRAEDYARFRPRYPQAVLNIMEIECGLSTHHKIADIGSGTGILSELFLRNRNLVYGVEPNRQMREKAETLLKEFPWFISVAGTAEATTLHQHCVDWITIGQAFHWFDREKARQECLRILKPHGWTLIINNNRQHTTAFMRGYERLLRSLGPAYRDSCNRTVPAEAYADFFGKGTHQNTAIENHQDLDWDGLRGRYFSSSYTPDPSSPDGKTILAELRELFQKFERGGKVRMEYLTVLHFGQMA